ncbi:MAG: nucleotide exchange factor GrpE [Bacteroidota bacterium]
MNHAAQDDPEKEVVDTEQQAEEAPANEADTTAEESTDAAPETGASEQQLKDMNDKFLRLYSEFENFRRRTAKERLELVKSAGEEVITELLAVLDDFERAIAHNEGSEDLEAIKEGFQLVHQKLRNALVAKGLKPMESQGEVFDTDRHEALTKIPAPSKKLKGKVVDVIEKGYYLNDKVIRYAKVVIGE